MARKKEEDVDEVQDGVPGVVEDLDEAAELAREEAEEAGVTPSAVMRTTPEAAVTGDGVVMSPDGPADEEKKDEAKKGAKRGARKASKK